jgi:hypothetical protein
MLHATSSKCVAPARQYGSGSSAIPATSRPAAAAGPGPPKAGAGSAEGPAKLCCCKSCTADHDILDLKTHYTKDKGMYSAFAVG